MNAKNFDSFSGQQTSVFPYNEAVGEEKRVEAGLQCLSGRAPANVTMYIFPPNIYRGAPAGYHDYDVVVPMIAATFSGSFSGRQVVLLGQVAFHVTGGDSLDGETLYVDAEEIFDPLLLVKGSDGSWHSYRGQVVRSWARRIVENELSRRAVTKYDSDVYNLLPNEAIDFEGIAAEVERFDGDGLASWKDWQEIASRLSAESVAN